MAPETTSSHQAPDQSRFQDCYRGRQSWLHHMAYMRMAKVLAALQVLEDLRMNLAGREIFDYGFGAGTFFRYCPPDAHLYGVEQDVQNVSSVINMLREQGYQKIDLEPIEIEIWEKHPLLNRQYDFILCSHVMEHLPDPKGFLMRVTRCLKSDGVFMGIVPINERVMNLHHVTKVTRKQIEEWAAQPGLEICHYQELDPLMYWIQPLFNHDAGTYHKIAQGVSFGMGAIATFLGAHAWNKFGRLCANILPLKPTQAVFVIRLNMGNALS